MDYLDRLIAERIDRDLTQREVAAVINKSQQGYDHIEKRRAKLTIEDFTKLCEFYNIQPSYFLGFTDDKVPLQ
ncbi:MAG: helix-turn-helix transcriptional regulator [Clostridia bacterium]|nr:helix-turn-helix transcriptional regulator [Clostridia bacterium]